MENLFIKELESAVSDLQYGNLLPEFIDFLVEEPNRKLVRKLWLIITTVENDSAIKEVGALFLGSNCQEDLNELYSTFIANYWPLVPTCLAKVEIESME